MSKQTYNDFQDAVVDAVTIQLEGHDWFTGVCLEGLDEFYLRNDLPGAVEHAYCQTMYYDAPNYGLPLTFLEE